ncbi:MAG: hypothetical protein ACYC6X_02425 [Minisyncoccota bacterium]
MNTKKVLIWGSSISILLFLFSFYLFSGNWCYEGSACNNIEYAVSKSGIYESVFFLSLSLFLFSLITYKMRDEVFRAWLHFAYWWVPLTIFLTLITPNGHGGWGIPSLIDPGFVAFVFSTLFALISLGIIFVKFLKVRGQW